MTGSKAGIDPHPAAWVWVNEKPGYNHWGGKQKQEQFKEGAKHCKEGKKLQYLLDFHSQNAETENLNRAERGTETATHYWREDASIFIYITGPVA